MSENIERFRKIETIRHGEKRGEELSERGVEQARQKAKELFAEIETGPAGGVFYIMPSIVERARMTRDIIESELRALVQEEQGEQQGIEFISVKDVEKIKKAKGDFSRKYIITDLAPSTLLGFKGDKPISSAPYVRLRNVFKGDEEVTGMTWAARADEVKPFQEKVREKFPDVEAGSVDPKNFREPPEEAALRYLRLMKRMGEITEKFFPDHPWKSLYVGHAPAVDFATMAMMGKDISIRTVDELGGRLRDFLESSHFEIKEGKTIVRYRDQEVEAEQDLDTVIEDLTQKSEERKKEWGTTS